jgi:hypothetical protein
MKTVTVEVSEESFRILGEERGGMGRNMLIAAVLQRLLETIITIPVIYLYH